MNAPDTAMKKSPKVLLYASQWCGYCRAAKSLLSDRQIPFEEIDVTNDPDTRSEVAARYNWPTVPVILMDGTLIGGFSELSDMDREGGLDLLR